MAIQNDNTLVTKGDLKALYSDKIAPYLGANLAVRTNVSDYYSEDEKVVGVWTDGKPVYQKTVQLSAMTSAVTMYQMTDLGISNIDKPLFLEGFMINSTGWKLASPFWQTTSDFMVMSLFNEQIRICSPSWSTYTSGYATIKYTKTTDAVNSAVTTPGCYDINRPDLWPANQEIFFGNGLYGIRATGRITSSGNTVIANASNVSRIINNGGCGITTWKVAIGSWFNSNNYSSNVCYNPIGTLEVNFGSEYVGASYDIWVTYTK